MLKISKNFTLEEFTESNLAKKLNIDNRIEKSEYISNICNLVEYVLQPLRDYLGVPIHINSGYRCKELNRVVGGVYNSQHMTGKAADIVCKDLSKAMKWIIESKKFDQVIRYNDFIHVSYDTFNNRKQVIHKNLKS